MKRRYLEKGDVVLIRPGMLVETEGFRRSFFHADHISPFDHETYSHWVHVGRIYSNRTDVSKERGIIRHAIVTALAKLLVPFDESIVDRFVRHQVRDQPAMQLVVPDGHYVVTQVIEEKGNRYVDLEGLNDAAPTKIRFWQMGWGPLAHNDIKPVEGFDG